MILAGPGQAGPVPLPLARCRAAVPEGAGEGGVPC
jgi:hypothetical protein